VLSRPSAPSQQFSLFFTYSCALLYSYIRQLPSNTPHHFSYILTVSYLSAISQLRHSLFQVPPRLSHTSAVLTPFYSLLSVSSRFRRPSATSQLLRSTICQLLCSTLYRFSLTPALLMWFPTLQFISYLAPPALSHSSAKLLRSFICQLFCSTLDRLFVVF
jgi:hypothetical protein